MDVHAHLDEARHHRLDLRLAGAFFHDDYHCIDLHLHPYVRLQLYIRSVRLQLYVRSVRLQPD
jgi:hypothetical protein